MIQSQTGTIDGFRSRPSGLQLPGVETARKEIAETRVTAHCGTVLIDPSRTRGPTRGIPMQRRGFTVITGEGTHLLAWPRPERAGRSAVSNDCVPAMRRAMMVGGVRPDRCRVQPTWVRGRRRLGAGQHESPSPFARFVDRGPNRAALYGSASGEPEMPPAEPTGQCLRGRR